MSKPRFALKFVGDGTPVPVLVGNRFIIIGDYLEAVSEIEVEDIELLVTTTEDGQLVSFAFPVRHSGPIEITEQATVNRPTEAWELDAEDDEDDDDDED